MSISYEYREGQRDLVTAQRRRGPYRVLVTGSRDWQGPFRIDGELDAIRADFSFMTVVHGGARGADALAELWARRNDVPTEVHNAQWSRWGRRAGIQRNIEMVLSGANVCLAFIRNRSAGATHCASVAAAAGIPLIIVRDDSPALSEFEALLLPEAYMTGLPGGITESTVEEHS